MIEKQPEHETIRKIFFIENKPTPLLLYPGAWLIFTWDGAGCVVPIGLRKYQWYQKDEALQYLQDLQDICNEVVVEYFSPSDPGIERIKELINQRAQN